MDWYSTIRHSVDCKIMVRFPKKVLLVKAEMLQQEYLASCLKNDVQPDSVLITPGWIDGLLTEYLISNLKERPGLKLALRVDEACPHGKFIEALGAASEAGYGQDDIVLPVKSSKVESPVTTPENP